MSSLSEYERKGLEDVFLCLGEEQSLCEKLNEQTNRLISGLSLMTKKGISLGFCFSKSKNIMFRERRKVNNFKLLSYFRPKNRGPK